MSKLIIRKAKHSDVDDICELWCDFMDFHAAHDRSYRRSRRGRKIFHDFIHRQISSRSALVLVAVIDRTPVGYELARLAARSPVFADRKCGSIDDLAVAERFRGRGIGTRLYREAVRWFRKRGIARIELTVATSNPVSMRFWDRHGFESYHERRFKTLRL